MDFLKELLNQITGFFNYGNLLSIIKSGDYSKLLTYDGFVALLIPLFPLFVVIEIIRAAFFRRFKVIHYKLPFFSYVLNAVIGRMISFAMIGICIGLFEKHAIFHTTFTWYWFIYGYVVWEFGHFLYHYWGHKVRLFWCLHSTHHAPETMNLSVSYAHFFLEGPYADTIRTTVCILLGVNPAMLFVIMFIDGFWGSFIHIGENLIKDARLGFLNNILLTPSHHRVHHARNPNYMDTNFCNLLPIWDRAFGTYYAEDRSIPIEYGISRPMIKNSFLDAYFGEIVALAKDVYRAPGIVNKFMYVVMPPGWSHTGDHKMTSVVKKKYYEDLASKENQLTNTAKGANENQVLTT
ncbi:Sterol desaturase/sphingolipid hydroxylase, fatty acid hydroxylase superfamily [Mucilaginibacter pineti]|uniref:Sterol desaturase/sphingolipid hydroxylase, fatty acid hydroxylase superfamily n=1 Tax=Mucilaginibacter pineti TaxID=1391627 RepID=A0A1G7J0U2_9SPHI|nr:sterol desaturase family protein [Mucilaginibacter pineti]SDF18495.1 Sterol desaturase/sphingolipid hydroxylase, fatty acid hydroxylase superfamily [Mucilaginibacter pineti]